MPFYVDDDPDEELRVLAEWRRRTTAAGLRAGTWTPAMSNTLVRWAELAPHVDPDAMLSFARTGIDPLSEIGQEVGRLAAVDYWQGFRRGREPDPVERVRAATRRVTQAAANVPELDRDTGGRGFMEQVGGIVRGARDFINQGNDVARANIGEGIEDVTEGISDLREVGELQARTNPVVGDTADNPVANAVRPAARTAFMALDAPRQELVGGFRRAVGEVRESGWAAALNPFDDQTQAFIAERAGTASESDAGIALSRLLRGQDVDTGAGLYVDPESGVAQERYRRELRSGTIDGQGITVGRWFTDTFTGLDHGDTGYGFASGLIDAGVAMGADPVDWAGGAALRASRARRQFTGGAGELPESVRPAFLDASARELAEEEVGLLPRGIVPDKDAPTLAGWATSPPAQAMWNDMAATSDFYTLWKATQGKIRPDVLLRVADEGDPDGVLRIAMDEMRLNLGPDFTYARPDLNRGTWARRTTADMPVDRIRTDDPTGFLNGLEGLLVDGRVPLEDVQRLMREGAEAANPLDRVNVFERGLARVGETLADEFGVDPAVARSLTGWVTEGHRQQARMFFLSDDSASAVAARPATSTAVVNGEATFLRNAHLDSEMAPDVINVPNVREIRRMTGALRDMQPLLYDAASGKLKLPWRMMEGLSNNIWKRITLLRVAWPVRQVLIDEQLRLAAVGMPSMWRHPIQLLAGMLDDGFERAALAAGDDPNGLLVASDELQGSLLRNIPYSDVKRKALDEWQPILRDDERFVGAWGRELSQLHASRVARRLAENRSVEATLDDLLNGDLQDLATSVAQRPHHAIEGEQALREWVETVALRLREKTGGNDDLLNAVRDGYLHGNDGPIPFWNGTQQGDGLTDRLAGYLDAAPAQVKGQSDVVTRLPGQISDTWDKATNTLFGWLGALPSNRLSRSPAWRHNYFESLIEKFPLLSPEAQERALAAARRARTASGINVSILGRELGVGGDLLARMEAAAARGVSGDVPWDAANQYARVRAMNEVQDLLGDLTTKNHLTDAVRVFMPFASAWREMVGAYLKILKTNPLIVYDIGKGVRGSIQAGFFYKDTNGEWIFNYPGSETLMEHIPGGPGVPFPLTGRVQGLTMGFEVTPGFGPMAQLPASWIIPDTPRWDGFRDLVMPYGTEDNPIHFVTPEWLEKVGVYLANQDEDTAAGGFARLLGSMLGGTDPASAAQYGSSVGDVMTYLSSTGEYDLSSPAEVARLADDAKQRAASLWLWRGLAQFSLPSAPRPLGTFMDDENELTLIPVASERYYQLLEEDPIHAGQRFLEEFGELAFMLLEPKSESNALYVPMDRAGFDWAREHAELLERHPVVGGLFAPVGGGDAGIGAYLRAVEEGERTPVDPGVRFARAQDQLGSILYNIARAQALKAARRNGRSSIPEEGMDALREYREQLMDRYPGYLAEGRSIRDIERTITDLRSAMDDEPTLRDSEAGEGLRAYLDLRDYALQRLDETGTADSLTSDAAAPLRDVLRAQGEQLVAEYGDFATMWDRIFLRELEVAE